MKAARENTGCFRRGGDGKMQRGRSVTLVTVKQMVHVRRRARKQFLPPCLGKEGPSGSLNLDVNIFEGPGVSVCVEQQTSTCLAYLPEDSVCVARTYLPWAAVAVGD